MFSGMLNDVARWWSGIFSGIQIDPGQMPGGGTKTKEDKLIDNLKEGDFSEGSFGYGKHKGKYKTDWGGTIGDPNAIPDPSKLEELKTLISGVKQAFVDMSISI